MSAPLVLDLASSQASDARLSGGKAARLAELVAAGFPVPGGVVATTAAFDRFVEASAATEVAIRSAPFPPDLHEALERALVPWSTGPVAVRSSAIAEDLPDASFAGQYESVIDVAGIPAILGAIRTCWASALAPRLLAYRSNRSADGPPRIAVLIQALVRADAAGVAFTADPVTGRRDEVLVDAVRGLGERLVSGSATADHWRVPADGEPFARNVTEHALEPDQVVEIAALARRVAEHYGEPQDIEWAFAQRRLSLLQARPITALPEVVDWTPPAPGLWVRTFRLGEWLGEPITPLFETWLLERMERRLFARFETVVPVPTPQPYHVIVHGWYYTTANFVPRSIPHGLWLLVRYLLPALVRSPTALSVLVPPFAHRGMAFFEREWRSGPRDRYEAAVRDGLAGVERCDATQLRQLVDELADLAGDEVFYFFLVGGSAWKVETRLAAFYDRHLAGRIGGSHQDLLQGLGEAPATHAHLTVSLDWFHPTLGELGLSLDAEDGRRRSEAARRREDAVRRATEALADSPSSSRRFRTLSERAQHFGRVREEQAHRLTLAWPLLRRAVQRLAELAGAQDPYFLTREELCSGSPSSAASERRARWERRRRLSAPTWVGTMGFPQRQVFAGHGSGTKPDGVVRGAPASPGRVTGRVRVVLGVGSFDALQPGEILVAPATNPGWTPLFARAAAVVTDTGSVMAHASLVAREYGIAAVVGTGNATRVLHDGDLVVVDGAAGTVERVT